MHLLYGTPPGRLATVSIFGRPTAVELDAGQEKVPADATQCSPLIPDSSRLDAFAEGIADGLTIAAPRGTLERRHVLALGLRALRAGGHFTVMAHNKLGGARLADELADFGCEVSSDARHHFRICTGTRPGQLAGIDAAIAAGAPRQLPDLGLWSQPGIFSWDRIDAGTALLVEHLPALSGRGADLGCGIGTLARTVLAQDAVTRLELVDLDRRAIAAARRNLDDARARFHWASVETLTLSELDFVVMNPPFHDGSTENPDLGRAFIRTAARALRSGGECLLVANRHLPYEAAIKPLFAAVDLLAQRDGFKVYRARK